LSPIRTLPLLPSVLAMTRWRTNPAAVLAALWATAFCVAHVYWAFGGTGLLPRGFRITDRSGYLAVNLIAIPLCLIGSVLAWRVASGGYRRWLFIVGSAGATLMLWHAGLNFLFLGIRSSLGQPLTDSDRYYALLYEPFWLLGGILWLLAVLRFRTPRDRAALASQKSPARTLWDEIPADPALNSSTETLQWAQARSASMRRSQRQPVP
jgi:hypothetical protein